MNALAPTRGMLLLIALLLGALLAGCGSSIIPALIGGGLPPGEPDIGGVVVQEVVVTTGSDVDGPAAEIPVPGAEVRLMRSMRQLATATTGPTGYFSFEAPPTGSYRVEVTPPTGSGLRGMHHEFHHQGGQQTFLRIVLKRQ